MQRGYLRDAFQRKWPIVGLLDPLWRGLLDIRLSHTNLVPQLRWMSLTNCSIWFYLITHLLGSVGNWSCRIMNPDHASVTWGLHEVSHWATCWNVPVNGPHWKCDTVTEFYISENWSICDWELSVHVVSVVFIELVVHLKIPHLKLGPDPVHTCQAMV